MSSEKVLTKYNLRLATETDTHKIAEYINEYKKNYPNKTTNKSFISALTNLDDYSELNIRYGLYNFSEEFILVESNQKIEGLVSINVPQNLSKVFNLKLILFNNLNINLLKEIINYSLTSLPELSIVAATKIRITVESDTELTQYWIDIFNKLGFTYETTRKYELKSAKSVITLTINTTLSKELIV